MFFTFNQNNSGGHFDLDKDEGISQYVIIEANSARQANSLALGIGLYFDGVSKGHDCECCGDRWYEQWNDTDGDNSPLIYGESPVKVNSMFMDEGETGCIHYLDGRKEWF